MTDKLIIKQDLRFVIPAFRGRLETGTIYERVFDIEEAREIYNRLHEHFRDDGPSAYQHPADQSS